MSYKLSDFYVGVVDFFSILLPGALITFLFKDSDIWSAVFDPILPSIDGSIQKWAVFIVASYLLGHFVFLVASYLDHIYDFLVGGKRTSELIGHYLLLGSCLLDRAYAFITRRAKKHQVRETVQVLLSKRKAVRRIRDSVFRVRDVIFRVFISTKENPSAITMHVARIRDERIDEADNKDLINAFQWAKANLMLQYPAAAVEVQRFEADSKFFRSLVIVLSLVSITVLIQTAWLALLACTILTILSFWGYLKRRWKGIQLAYTYYVASENIPNPEPPQ